MRTVILIVCAAVIINAILNAPDIVFTAATGGPRWPVFAHMIATFIACNVAERVLGKWLRE